MPCVKNLPGHPDIVANLRKFFHKFVQKRSLPAYGQALDIFEYKRSGLQLNNDTHEIADKSIAGIVENTMSDQRKSLAGSATENTIYLSLANSCRLNKVFAGDILDRPGDCH